MAPRNEIVIVDISSIAISAFTNIFINSIISLKQSLSVVVKSKTLEQQRLYNDLVLLYKITLGLITVNISSG